MTADKILSAALTLMFGTDQNAAEYSPYFLNTANLLLSENFSLNNALRALKGKEPLLDIPQITSLYDDIVYEDEFTLAILPYGVAGYIYTDDDKSIGQAYKNKYEYERARIIKSGYEDIKDVY